MTSTVNTLGYLAPVKDLGTSLNAVESIVTLDGVASTTAGVAGRSGKGLVISTGDGGASTTGSAGSASALELVGGDGGASSGGGAGGLGATLKFTAGNGSATNGNGGFIRLAPGTGNGTGVNGAVIKHIPDMTPANIQINAGGSITTKQLLNGYLTIGSGAAPYAVNIANGVAAALVAAIPNIATGDSFKVLIRNVVAQIATWTSLDASITVDGVATLAASHNAYAHFIYQGAGAWLTFLSHN